MSVLETCFNGSDLFFEASCFKLFVPERFKRYVHFFLSHYRDEFSICWATGISDYKQVSQFPRQQKSGVLGIGRTVSDPEPHLLSHRWDWSVSYWNYIGHVYRAGKTAARMLPFSSSLL